MAAPDITGQSPVNDGILDGWDAIEPYVGTDRRNAMRWVKERGMPVHREKQRRRVYALRTELDIWLASPRNPRNPAIQCVPAGGSLPPGEAKGLRHAFTPYMGPVSFPRGKPDLFFGRDDEVSQLLDLLVVQARRVVLLFGPSGAGKTSLVNTALTQALANLGYLVLPAARVGGRPQADLTAVPVNSYTFSALRSMQADYTEEGNLSSLTWNDFVKSRSDPAKAGTILVIDQLEEILNPGCCPYAHVSGFFAQLHLALVENPRLHIVLVFREEFLGPLRRLAEELANYWCEFILRQLDSSKAAMAIKEPAKSQGVQLEQRLVEMLVGELSKGKHALYHGGIIDEKKNSVEPLHLQLVCHALWNSLPEGLLSVTVDNSEPFLSAVIRTHSITPASAAPETLIAAFVSLVLQTFFDNAVGRTAQTGTTRYGRNFPSELIDLGCLQFITERRTRTPPIRQGPEYTGNLPNWVVEELGRHHMLRAEEHGTERVWELAHDAWIEPVLRRGGKIDKSALRDLYVRAVKGIADKGIRAAETSDEAAIHLGCLAFVDGQPGRLSPFLLDALAGEGLLRRKGNGGDLRFELSHSDLGPAIADVRLQGDLDARLAALKALKVFADRALQEQEGSLTNWFDDHDSVLKSLRWDLTWPFLYEFEAEFILRASFATGYGLDRWLGQMNRRAPSVAATVLKEAADAPNNCVRGRAAANLGLLGLRGSGELLVKLAVVDSDESVRRAAAVTLANPDQIDCWRTIAAYCGGRMRRRALEALAWVWEISVRRGRQREFEAWLRDAPKRVRTGTYLERARIRFKASFARTAVLSVIGAMGCGVFTAITRTVPGRFIGTLTQNPGEYGFHWFNGLIGGGVWGLTIPAVLLMWRYVFARPKPARSGSAPWSAASAGAVGGLLGGLINTVIMLGGVASDWLHKAGWLPTLESHWIEAFTNSRFGFSYFVFGVLLGIGMGFSFHSMLAKRKTDVENDRAVLRRFEDLPAILWYCVRWCIGRSTWIAFFMAVAAILFAAIPHPMDFRHFAFSGEPLVWRIIGEAISVYLGGLGIITALYLGLLLLSKGIRIEGRDEFLNMQ